MEDAEAALDRWVGALNRRGDEAATARAVAPDVVLERYGTGPCSGERVERLEGAGEVAAWLARSPEAARFELEGPPGTDDEGEDPALITARYRVVVEDFVGRGAWRLRLDDAGRIRWLAHVPDELPAAYR